MMLKLATMTLLLALSVSAYARNPGESAQECVDVSKGSAGKVSFSNSCGEKIFVIYCGDLKYSKQRCGSGPKGGFYTHSINLAPGQSNDVAFDGRFSYAACKGGISFGNDGEYIDNPSGGVQCLKR